MATAAVIGLSTGKRLLSSSFHSSDLPDKFFPVHDCLPNSSKSVIVGKKSANFGSGALPNGYAQSKHVKALKEHAEGSSVPSTVGVWRQNSELLEEEEEPPDIESSVEVLLLLQKSMLEKQLSLPFDHQENFHARGLVKKLEVTRTKQSARQRRMSTRRKCINHNISMAIVGKRKELGVQIISPDLLRNRMKGYVKGVVSEELLTHAEVVHLSRKIKAGLSLEEHKIRLKKRLGCDPSDEQLATSLKMSRSELKFKIIECGLAREKLAMSNVRLVMSIAQKYDNMGAEMADLVQGGLIGLLRGIEKFDSSKGFKISTYVYWWIRQGVSRALVENSRTLRLPAHIHERLSSIRSAKIRLEEKGLTPSVEKIAENLNMSQKKVRNAVEAISQVFSLDREAFPSLNGLPGDTYHSYIADKNLENNPWHAVDEWSLKLLPSFFQNEVNRLIDVTLGERERDIIRLYYGLDKECLTWEDISKRIGLSRERVRQVGLVALEKLKHAARRRKLEAMLVKH